jgi:hypothetical protein
MKTIILMVLGVALLITSFLIPVHHLYHGEAPILNNELVWCGGLCFGGGLYRYLSSKGKVK